jgi:hypothetical protein
MPILLLALSFAIKLFVDRSVGIVEFIQSLFELPTEIAALAVSMIVAFIISDPKNTELGLAYFVLYIVGVILVVFLWRRSLKLLIETKRGTSRIRYNLQACIACAMAVVNYGIATTGLVHSVGLITP